VSADLEFLLAYKDLGNRVRGITVTAPVDLTISAGVRAGMRFYLVTR
jgi:hypothetical protein